MCVCEREREREYRLSEHSLSVETGRHNRAGEPESSDCVSHCTEWWWWCGVLCVVCVCVGRVWCVVMSERAERSIV